MLRQTTTTDCRRRQQHCRQCHEQHGSWHLPLQLLAASQQLRLLLLVPAA
jgi:hypothetical protein